MKQTLIKLMVATSVLTGSAITRTALAQSTIQNGAVTNSGSGCVIAGADTAPLTIEEFADFSCPYCSKSEVTIEQLLALYPGKLRLIFHNLPLTKVHPASLLAAKAFSAVCLQDANRAYTFQQVLFHNQDRVKSEGENYLFEAAASVGADITKMRADMQSPVVAQMIDADQKLADQHHFTGTPAFLIGAETILGAYPIENFKQAIDRQLPH